MALIIFIVYVQDCRHFIFSCSGSGNALCIKKDGRKLVPAVWHYADVIELCSARLCLVIIEIICDGSEFGLLLTKSDGLRHSLDLVCCHAAAEVAGEDNTL